MSVLFLIFILATQPVFLASDLNDYVRSLVPLPDGRVLYVDSDSNFWTVSCSSPGEKREWFSFWDYAEDGWLDVIRVSLLSGSPDGEKICFGVTVTAGAKIHVPEMILVCNSDGTDARPIALSMNVGSGPEFDFTMDSRFLYGSPLLSCLPSCESFIELSEGFHELPQADMIEIDTGERIDHGAALSDGFYSCHYSDLVCGGSYPPYMIYDMAASEVLLEVPDEETPILDQWVLPDAGLVIIGGIQFLRYSDGTLVENPGDAVSVFALMEDGRYLYSFNRGETVFCSEIDWSTFSGIDPVEQSGLGGILTNRGPFVVQDEVFYFTRADSLFFYSIKTR